MSIEGLIILLIVGAIAGWLAGQIMRGFGFGLIGNIIVGIVGAFIASWLLPRIGIVIGGNILGGGCAVGRALRPTARASALSASPARPARY